MSGSTNIIEYTRMWNFPWLSIDKLVTYVKIAQIDDMKIVQVKFDLPSGGKYPIMMEKHGVFGQIH